MYPRLVESGGDALPKSDFESGAQADLCSAERIVQAVLRGNPSAFACASSEIIPAVISALPNRMIRQWLHMNPLPADAKPTV
jgi:hypothetical protein